MDKVEKAFETGYEVKETFRGGIVEALIKAGQDGLTSHEVQDLTGQTTPKLARQSIRKARWKLFEAGYRLVFDNSREEDTGLKIYRALKVEGVDTRFSKLCRTKEVTAYSIKIAS